MIDAGKIFALQGNVISCEAYGSGHINRTFLVCTDVCNVFWADTAREAQAYFDIGADCLLTNDFQRVRAGLENMKHD